MHGSDKIRIIVEGEQDHTKEAFPSYSEFSAKVTRSAEISLDTIHSNLSEFLKKIHTMLDSSDIYNSSSTYTIDEVQISLVVNGSGGIELIGKIHGGAEAGIKVTFKRLKKKE